MCGICGQFNFSSSAPVVFEDIVGMTRTMPHRGPDDEGFYVSGSIGLGFRRLSIIDLGAGRQPMADAEESVWVVFNGEIYNFPEVRRELEASGHRFRTNSDTEVIVHGYKQWGDDVLSHLNGMFGLAVWDVHKRRLMLARDRMGIKPVYFRIENGSLLFGSEMRPILSALPNLPELDATAIELFLRYRYTPAPATIFKGIRKLGAGTRLIAEQGRAPRVERWWDFAPRPFDPMPSDRDAEEQLLAIYQAAVKRHLISDVPVGLLLSGGIDSALLLGLMSRDGGPWKSYTVGYGQSFADDELRDARRTAELLGSSHTSVQIDHSVFADSLEKVVSIMEEPVATSSVIPMYFVCQSARQDVKVALIGQGPDELFGGYQRHLGVRYAQHWRALPKGLRAIAKQLLRLLPRHEAVKRALYSLDVNDRMGRYQQVFSIVDAIAIRDLFRNDALPQTSDGFPELWDELAPMMQQTDELGGLQFLEIRSSLPDELLLYADKISMAHSLELRVPYLDQEVVEYAERLSASFKIRNGTRKWLHRRVARTFLPKEVMNRKKKGFASNVVDDWFRTSLSNEMESVFRDSQSLIFGYLRHAAVQRLWANHKSGREDNHKILFSLIMLEHLLRKYEAQGRQPNRTVPQLSVGLLTHEGTTP
jgi:asparagine synthase (glutamine-hydrolysing)